jgi:hypothetical protein
MMRRDALDKLLAKTDEEFARSILQLEELAEMVAEVNNAKKAKLRDQLRDFKDQLLGQAVDDNGEVINEDIAEAIDFFENESLPDLEDLVESLTESLTESLDSLKEGYQNLKAVRKATPLNAFFVAEQEEDEEDEEDGDEDEATDRD